MIVSHTVCITFLLTTLLFYVIILLVYPRGCDISILPQGRIRRTACGATESEIGREMKENELEQQYEAKLIRKVEDKGNRIKDAKGKRKVEREHLEKEDEEETLQRTSEAHPQIRQPVSSHPH
jgi:primosomal protein N''